MFFKSNKKIKQNFIDIGIIYTVGQILIKGTSFLLIPLYSKKLGVEIYGQLTLVDMIYSIVSIFLIFSVYSGYLRFYSEDKTGDIFSTIINFSIISILTQGILLIFIEKFFLKNFGDIINIKYLLILIFIRCTLDQFINIFEVSYSMKYQVKQIIFYRFIISILSLSSIIYLILYQNRGIEGIYLGNIIGNIPIFIYLVLINRKKFKWLFNWKEFRPIFKYSGGLLLGSSAYFILNMIDRIFLEKYDGLYNVGIYSMGYRFAILIEIFYICSFKKIFIPFKFKNYSEKNYELNINKFYWYYNILGILLFLIISVNIKLILLIFTTKKFIQAYLITPWIVLSYLIYGQAEFYTIGLQLKNKVYIDSIVIFLGGMINIILNIILIKKYGMFGATGSTILSYMIMNILYYIVSQKLFYIKFNIKDMLKKYISGLIIYLFYLKISRLDLNIICETIIGNLIIIIYIYYLYKYVISKEEKKEILSYIKQKIG